MSFIVKIILDKFKNVYTSMKYRENQTVNH